MDARPRFRRSLAIALLAHAGAFAWTIQSDRERAMSAAAAPTLRTEQELIVDVEPPAPVAGPAEVAESGAKVARPPAMARSSSTTTPRGSSANGAAAEASAAPADSAEAGSWTLSPAPPVSSGTRFSSAALDEAIRAGVRTTVAESTKRRDARKPILGGFSQHDIELGFIPGGEFVNLARDTVRTSVAPTVGHATLEIEIDAAGILTSVRVLDASSDRVDWEQAAAAIAKAAHGHTTRVPHGGQGVAMTVDVTSAMKTLSGGSTTGGAFSKILGAINDPIDTMIDGTVPPQRVVTARVVDVQVL